MNIAILDSGIDTLYCVNNNLSYSGLSYYFDKQGIIQKSKNIIDKNGHGTHCVDLIRKFFPQVEFYIVKILNDEGKCNIFLLETALKGLIYSDIDIILLSLSIIDSNVSNVKSIIDQLTYNGKIIIASANNNVLFSYPSIYENVVGVSGIFTKKNLEYYHSNLQNLDFVFDSTPIYVKGIKNENVFFRGTSKAACMATVKICQIKQNSNYKLSKDEIVEKLKTDSLGFTFREHTIKNKKKYFSSYGFDVSHVITIFCEMFGCNADELQTKRLLSLLQEENQLKLFDEFFHQLEMQVKISVNLHFFTYRNFTWFWCLLDFIENNRINQIQDFHKC